MAVSTATGLGLVQGIPTMPEVSVVITMDAHNCQTPVTVWGLEK